MSIGKSLAEKYADKNISEIEVVLNKIGNFQSSLKKISKEKAFYDVCHVFSSENLSQDKINEIKRKYNISVDVKIENHIDENILGGEVVYYQGKKWDGSMRGIFNRFNEM
jgi:F0F1-type ATP synthase delta subunit